jgi:hypothetical protein
MANFLSQAQRYDGQELEAVILDMQDELQDEVETRATLDSDSQKKIDEAKDFLTSNFARVDAQLERLTDLDAKIRKSVAENEQLQSADAEYTALITSEPYVSLADKIGSLYAISSELSNFLVQKGRRGRLPLN